MGELGDSGFIVFTVDDDAELGSRLQPGLDRLTLDAGPAVRYEAAPSDSRLIIGGVKRRMTVTLALRDIKDVRVTTAGARLIRCREDASGESISRADRNVRCPDLRRSDKTAGGWLPFRLSALDRLSKNRAGRTRFEL